MADSTITKKALAAALKELMTEVPFHKIQVAHICERCNMNRKSFYYHFKDKYDLLNWIFDTFAQNTSDSQDIEQYVEALRAFYHYLYDNREFYRKALKIQGQNSFSEHFREYIMPIIRLRMSNLLGSDVDDFELKFFTDAMVCTIERWLLEKDCMPPDLFLNKLLSLVFRGSEALYKVMNRMENN